MFFAVLCSSMLGAQILGVSLNKIALIPLELYLFIKMSEKGIPQINSTQKTFFCFFYVLILSSCLNFSRVSVDGMNEKLALNIVQYILIYIPILLLIGNLNNASNLLKRCVVVVAKINCIWAAVQFICWYSIKFDFNSFIFENLLHGLLGTDWTCWNYETLTLAIRVTGLNCDPAYFALLMVLGFFFTDSRLWKSLFFFSCILAMSRVGMVSICGALFLRKIVLNYRDLAQHPKRICQLLIYLGLAILVMIFLYNSYEMVEFQVDYFISRCLTVFDGTSSGTQRHILYIPLALYVWLDSTIVSMLFGIGPRMGGVALSMSDFAMERISIISNSVWTIECDFAELLLGTGISGFCLYYLFVWQLIRKERNIEANQLPIYSLFIFGFMYDIAFSTLINLLFISYSTKNSRGL